MGYGRHNARMDAVIAAIISPVRAVAGSQMMPGGQLRREGLTKNRCVGGELLTWEELRYPRSRRFQRQRTSACNDRSGILLVRNARRFHIADEHIEPRDQQNDLASAFGTETVEKRL
jgi:hypothetical protein